MSTALLDIKNLKVAFHLFDGTIRAVDGIDLTLNRGEIVAVVGESGCGKTTLGLSIMGLVPSPPGIVSAEYISFEDRDLLCVSAEEMRKIRGNDISMIFQDALAAFNPAYTVGRQITEPLRIHYKLDFIKARQKCIELLSLLSMQDIIESFDHFPHQLSGGMRQKALIAMALSCNPSLVIADEPTSAIDAITQAKTLDTLRNRCRDLSMSMLFITHDFNIVAQIADRTVVMYAGKVVESTNNISGLLTKPIHPYTQGLISSLLHDGTTRGAKVNALSGDMPNPLCLPTGCRFRIRCVYCMPICREQEPPLINEGRGAVRCWLYYNEVENG